jgi:uncharacterized protein (DUF3820 family)
MTAVVKLDPKNEIDAPAIGGEVDYTALMALSRELVPTGFLPEHIKTPGQAVAIILTGRELGMAPMRALRSLIMVKGKVTENADSQLARFKSDGGRAKFTTLDEQSAVLALTHPNGDTHTETFTLEDAKRAGLLSSMGWQKFPKAMLRSRAITAGLKSVGWEGGTGVYDPAELGVPLDNEEAVTVAVKLPKELPAAKPSADKRMPFGKRKGERLGDIPAEELASALQWCRDKGKFGDLVAALEEVLADRADAAQDTLEKGEPEYEPSTVASATVQTFKESLEESDDESLPF